MAQNIPAEYLGHDYGFTAVDETEFARLSTPPVEMPPSLPADILEKILDRLESKIDDLNLKFDDIQSAETVKVTSDEFGIKIRKLEAIIVPLLNNLLKTADKEYIYWPNRREILQKQLDAVLLITRG